jgi:hypothetical protein
MNADSDAKRSFRLRRNMRSVVVMIKVRQQDDVLTFWSSRLS